MRGAETNAAHPAGEIASESEGDRVGLMNRKRESYNWLDDPFDEKKAAAERERAGMSRNAKLALGCGFALVVLAFILLAGFALGGMMGILA